MNTENQHIDHINLIGKYLAKEANKEEIVTLEEWVKENVVNQKIFREYKQTWLLSNSENIDNDINLNEEWSKLNTRLFNDKNQIDRSQSNTLNVKKLLRIAAIIVVLLTAGYFLYYLISKPSIEQLVAGNTIITTTLSDGTVVTLNNQAILKYPKIFDDNSRTVDLQGDAFFEVAHDQSKPFIITTKNIQIEVLGTSFYVNAKIENSAIEVFVKTGKVAISDKSSETILLTAGEKGTFNKSDGHLLKEKNQDPNFLSWKTGKLVFENESLIYVVDKINQTYHSNITIANPDINHCFLTATFENQPLEVILDVLVETFDLLIDKENGKILITGNGCE